MAEASYPMNAQGFNEWKLKFTSKDIRISKNGNIVYVTVMGVPDEAILIKNLGKSASSNKIIKIEPLGSNEKKRNQDNDYLKIRKPNMIQDKNTI